MKEINEQILSEVQKQEFIYKQRKVIYEGQTQVVKKKKEKTDQL